MMKVFIVYLLYFVKDATMQKTCKAENQYPWSYHGPDNDPSHWGDFYPDCNSEYQAPIAISSKDANGGESPELIFEGFDQPVTKAKVQNLGWTVMITPDDDVQRSINWEKYNFSLKNIHFHFGKEADPGSENVLNGDKYPMEIHYYIYDDAEEQSGVFSTFMDVADDDNSAFDSIIDVLSDVKYRNDSTDLKSEIRLLPPTTLLPEMHYYYYLYLGANSIPPCQPDYTWFILQDVGKVGRDQLATFMTLYSVGEDDASDECLMGPNARPVQDLDDRPIYWGYTEY